eukprot:2103746-Rhodomonas_salina.2
MLGQHALGWPPLFFNALAHTAHRGDYDGPRVDLVVLEGALDLELAKDLHVVLVLGADHAERDAGREELVADGGHTLVVVAVGAADALDVLGAEAFEVRLARARSARVLRAPECLVCLVRVPLLDQALRVERLLAAVHPAPHHLRGRRGAVADQALEHPRRAPWAQPLLAVGDV